MNNQLQSLNDKISERVGKELVDLIPEEQWKAIINSEINKFKTETAPRLIKEMLQKSYMQKADAILNEFTATQEWNEIAGGMIHKKLQDFIAQSSGEIFAGMLSPAMAIVLDDLRNRLRYG